MRKILKCSALWLLIACMVLQPIYIPKASAAEPAKTVTILFTHDMHDNFLPFKTEQNGTIVFSGGYARLQSAINQQKELDENALLLDAGDYSMGTPFQTIYQSDSPSLRILGQMGYDVVTLGNHEYDYRAVGLTDSLNAAKNSGDKLPRIVQSNVTFPTDDNGNLTESLTDLKQAMDNDSVMDYVVLERNGVKIGIFGLMGEESASMAPMSEVVFDDEVKQAKRVVKLLKEEEKVDLIICLSHSGTSTKKSKSEDEILAKKVPEINVIISGHTHTLLPQPIMVGETIIGSSGEYGSNLGVITISQQSDLSWQQDSYKLIPIDDSITEDAGILQRITDLKNIVQQKYFDKFNLNYDEVIANAPYNFNSVNYINGHHEESTLANLISDSFRYAVQKAEGDSYIPIAAAIVPAGTIRGTILEGDITTGDAFSVSSLGIGADKIPGYPLISVYLNGKEMKTICEVDASIAPIMADAQLFISGMNFTFNPHRLIFNKVLKASLENEDGTIEEIDDAKLYRVVVGLYSAQMLSVVGKKSFGLLSIIPKTKDGTPITDFEANIIYDTTNGNKSEIKEWYAVVEYLQSFEKENGVPKIPQYYQETQGRKIIDDNKNIFAILSNPNKLAIIVYIIIIAIPALIITVIVLIRKRSKNKKNNKKNNKKIKNKKI